ncbi:MAG: methyltransferase domain-containing protein [Myxococcota bacterium]|nr:methyltransferase domain-containing protein [Myxococcota bacterium]
MKYRLLKWLACPKCSGESFSIEVRQSNHQPVCSSHFLEGVIDGVNLEKLSETEIEEGALHCQKCSAVYPIVAGIPRMLVGDEGEKTHHRKTVFNTASNVWENNFLEISAPLVAQDFLGKAVLDLGCGYGRHTYFAARYGAEVIAIDNSEDALYSAKQNTKNLKHVHFIQADAANIPIKAQSIDRLYCYGLLHHVDDPKVVLAGATDVIRPGGTLSLWVYGPRQGLTLVMNNALRGVSTKMDEKQLVQLSVMIARFLRVFSHTPYRWFGKIPLAGGILSHLPVHEHHNWPFDVVVADICDRLRIPVKHWFTKEELEKWYGSSGYSNFTVRRRIRNNETFCSIGYRR